MGCLKYCRNYPPIVAMKGFHTHPFIPDVISLHGNPLFLKNICHAAGIIHINQGCILKGRFEVPLLKGTISASHSYLTIRSFHSVFASYLKLIVLRNLQWKSNFIAQPTMGACLLCERVPVMYVREGESLLAACSMLYNLQGWLKFSGGCFCLF